MPSVAVGSSPELFAFIMSPAPLAGKGDSFPPRSLLKMREILLAVHELVNFKKVLVVQST